MSSTYLDMRTLRGWPAFARASLVAALVLAVEPSSAQVAPSIVFTSTGSMNEPRYFDAAALLPSGEVLVNGGENFGGAGGSVIRFRASAELYSPSQGTFKLTDSMSIKRIEHTATTLPDGTVLIAGGISTQCTVCNGTTVSSAERYDPARKKFFPTGSMIAPRAGHSATLLDDGRVLIAGGYDLTTYLSGAELYDPATGTFSPAGPMFRARAFHHTATRLQDGRVLIVGGFAPAEIYLPASNTFVPTAGLGHPRGGGHTATLLPDGTVLIAGGIGFAPDNYEIAQAEVYDPLLGSFTLVGNLVVPRGNQGATLLANGHVLLVGGSSSSDILSSVELYDPSSGGFSLAGNMNGPRAGHVQIQLSSGDILVAGGVDGAHMVTSTAELFHP